MTRNQRLGAALAALALFAVVGVCGVLAARMVRAVWETVVQQSPAPTAPANADEDGSDYFTTTVTSSSYALQVDVSPTAGGSYLIHLFAYTPDMEPQRVVEWQGTAELPETDLEPVAISLIAVTEDHALGAVDLPAPGDWRLRFTLWLSDVDQATVTVTVPIASAGSPSI